MTIKEKYLVAAAYLFGFPALYIILSDHRKKPSIIGQGEQALVLWLGFFAVLIGLRFLINLLWLAIYIPYLNYLENLAVLIMIGYALYRAARALK